MARTLKIAVLPGDGIGPEIVEKAVRVLRAVEKSLSSFQLERQFYDASVARYSRTAKL